MDNLPEKLPVLKKTRINRQIECLICKNKFAPKDVVPLETIRDSLQRTIYGLHPKLIDESGYICQNDLNKIRKIYFKQLISEEKGDLSEVENSVVDALHEHESLTKKVKKQVRKQTFGERLSDQIAKFGGSWTFILLFLGATSIWVLWNTLSTEHFDPYPYILLNLFLSLMASLQAPIIMMSQNRQADRDRKNQEQDYKINLKSEVEIRVLNEKIDKLISHQWQRLLEIQEMQMDFMEELTNKKQ